MKVAIAVNGTRISPAFDFARTLLIVEVERGEVTGRRRETIDAMYPPVRAARLADTGAEALICGAISRPLEMLISARGVRVIPWIAGETEDVLAALLSGRLDDERFMMPGRCRRARRGRWSGRGHMGPGLFMGGRL